MAKPIRLGLVLEGEAAKEFWKNEKPLSLPQNSWPCLKKPRRFIEPIAADFNGQRKDLTRGA